MRRLLTTAVTSLLVFGSLASTADAYTNGAVPSLTSFTCNNNGTVTMVWDKNAGKPIEYSLTRVNPTPSASYRDRIPGARGSKGSYTVASSFTSPGYVIEAALYNRAGVVSTMLSATCP